MQIAAIIGHATATVKHSSLSGRRMLIAQPLDANDKADGDPVIAVGELGSGVGDRVILTSDGATVREMLGARNSPVRWAVLGVADV